MQSDAIKDWMCQRVCRSRIPTNSATDNLYAAINSFPVPYSSPEEERQ